MPSQNPICPPHTAHDRGVIPGYQRNWTRAHDLNTAALLSFNARERCRLKRAADRQIADLYRNLFRSTPVHFIQDDHDYFENEEAIVTGISFPPDDFMMRLARATQRLYFPEHLPDLGRPPGLPGTSESDRTSGLSECFGTVVLAKPDLIDKLRVAWYRLFAV